MSDDLRMQDKGVAGTSGYAENPDTYVAMANAISFDEIHRSILHLIPDAPSRVLDIGCCSGRDAAAFASHGHDVVAVEPFPKFLEQARRLHTSPDIEWICDSLPGLPCVHGPFDFILASAVWMHLDPTERNRAMARVTELLAPGAVFALTLRHGPVPPAKIMYPVCGKETIELAEQSGLEVVLHLQNQKSVLKRGDVTWTRIAVKKPGRELA